MKSLSVLVALALGFGSAAAQENIISTTQAFTVNGINVIVSPAENELVSMIVGLEGGLASGETTNPTLGEFTADLIVASGSKQYPKETLRRFLSQTSTQLSGGGDFRGINFSMTATRPNFDKAWEVLSSLVLDPLYDSIAFRNIRQQRITAVRERWAQAEVAASIISDSLLRIGNPLLSQWVKIEDVEAVTIPKAIELHNKLSERSRMFIVVVGKVTTDQIKEKLKVFAELPIGRYRAVAIPEFVVPTAPTVHVIDRGKTPTTYVSAAFVGPKFSDRDYWALAVGMSYLRSVLFEEIRTKRNLSYAPQSWLTTNMGLGVGKLAVSSVLPDSSMGIILTELAKMREGNFNEEDLLDAKQVYITSFYMARMTNAARAQAMYTSQRNAGDWRRAFSYDDINGVTKEAVQKAFRKYASNLQVGVVGTGASVTRDRYIYGNSSGN